MTPSPAHASPQLSNPDEANLKPSMELIYLFGIMWCAAHKADERAVLDRHGVGKFALELKMKLAKMLGCSPSTPLLPACVSHVCPIVVAALRWTHLRS